LNPILNAGSTPFQWFDELAYGSLIQETPDGQLAPGLATSWKYIGTGNKTFQMTLRPGVKFSDGTPLTAAGVVSFLEAFKKSNYAPYVSEMASIKATGPLTVQISSPGTSIFPDFFASNGDGAGQVVNPNLLATPNKLASETAGAGPYMLDTADTVPNSKYVYVPNPNYYDKAAIHWKRVVITVIADPNTTLAALQSGQVQVAEGGVATAAAAKAAGLNVTTGPAGLAMFMVTDPGGKLTPALGKTAVRQALGYAINRQAIAKALWGSYGSTSESPQAAGAPGYTAEANNYYTYNPGKAKQLLAQAGYPNGFSVTVLVSTGQPEMEQMTEAVASDWAKIGVKLKIVAPPPVVQRADLAKHLWGLFNVDLPYGNPIEATQLWFDAKTGLVNYFKYPFTTLSAETANAETQAPGTALTDSLAQMNSTIIEQGYEIPVATNPLIMFSAKSVTGITVPGNTPGPDPIYWSPAS
jgi:peptide/nickel transport system substrate-binding protein